KITPLFPSILTQVAVAEGEDLGTPTEFQSAPSLTQPNGIGGSGGDQVNLPYDSPLLSGHTSDRAEGSLNLKALSAFCTNLSNRVLALETVNDAQAKEILSWKRDVSTTRQELSTAGPTTTLITSTIFDDEEMTLADTLIKLKDDKAKGVAFKDSESTDRPARSILTLKPLPTIDPKDKGKGVLEEPDLATKRTKSDFDAAQIARDEEIARQLEVELQAEMERERQREEQASMDYIANLYDEVQERIDVDHELATLLLLDLQEDERMIRDMNKKGEEESSDKEDGTEIHMLTERRYQFTIRTLKRMLSLRMIIESASDAAYDLLRFVQKHIDESGGHDRGEKDI
nr:hypothetical protein [Tanacetum cinerariifolium]